MRHFSILDAPHRRTKNNIVRHPLPAAPDDFQSELPSSGSHLAVI
jgi:hypothetical protein